MNNLERGKKVLVTLFGGAVVSRRVWDVGERVVYLCTDGQYEKLKRGRTAPTPIGFPIQDVVYE